MYNGVGYAGKCHFNLINSFHHHGLSLICDIVQNLTFPFHLVSFSIWLIVSVSLGDNFPILPECVLLERQEHIHAHTHLQNEQNRKVYYVGILEYEEAYKCVENHVAEINQLS